MYNNEQHSNTVSSILAQVGSVLGIFSSLQEVYRCHSLQYAPFPLIPSKNTLQTFHEDKQEGQLISTTPLTPLQFSLFYTFDVIRKIIADHFGN